ncbi:hypothetical protein B0O99DRAFT_615030 [Bisporella sp. PMI_857]|nr:hypothetical protein B0O99DRAFT_615030 [Bisporella sp. PMI_857]
MMSEQLNLITTDPLKGRQYVNTIDSLNRTPLHVAVYHDFAEIAEVLIKNGANPQLVDCYGRSCLDWAASRSQELRQSMGSWYDGYCMTPVLEQKKILISSVHELTQRIKSLKKDPLYGTQFCHELGIALLLLSDMKDASIAFEQQLILDSAQNKLEHGYMCDHCQTSDNIEGLRFICLSCFTLSICSQCMAKHADGSNVDLRCKDHKFLQIPHEGYNTNDLDSLVFSDEARITWLDRLAEKYVNYSYTG